MDVGCGSGKFAEKLIENGYIVDCVSPSSNLNKHARLRLGNSVEMFETRFEDFECNKSYDLILCSESFQYLLLEKSISKIKKHLSTGGYLLICDFFKRDVPGKSPVSGGHGIKRFFKYMDSQPFVKLIDIDITRETAPSLDIMRDLILEVVLPTWNSIAFYMKSNYVQGIQF